eukprot:GHVT01002414.1.p2 GENE.GHVT01002414.1~~GHVT01002414.1.p2  ORF type:complete len:280 (-),score=55.89 GHVT01002414.1:415-1254(-)
MSRCSAGNLRRLCRAEIQGVSLRKLSAKDLPLPLPITRFQRRKFRRDPALSMPHYTSRYRLRDLPPAYVHSYIQDFRRSPDKYCSQDVEISNIVGPDGPSRAISPTPKRVTDVAPTTSGGLQQRKLLIRDIAMSCASPGGLRRWATGRFAAVRFPEVSEPPADRLKAQRQLAVGGRSYLKPDAAALLPPAGKDDLYLALSRASAAVGGLRRSPKGKEPTKRKPATISRSQFVSASLAGCWEDWTSEGSRAHLRLAVTVERSGSASPFASRIPAGKFDDC